MALKGHRHLRRPEAVGEALSALLRTLSVEIQGTLVGVSSIAPGADTLFAQTVLGMSLPWRALLPVSVAELRQDLSPADRQLQEQLLARATEVQVYGTRNGGVTVQPPSPQPSPTRGEGVRESAACAAEAHPGREGSERIQGGNEADGKVARESSACAAEAHSGREGSERIQGGNEADLECGMETVDQADLVIAIWDGQPAAAPGGTGDIVAYARAVGKPLIILNPDTLEQRREGWRARPFVDEELRYLNGLGEEPGMVPALPSPVPLNLLRFFAKVDRTASRTAPNFRRWVASSLLLNTGASLLVAGIIAFALRLPALDALAFLMTAGAMGAGFYLKYRKVHERWVHCRVAAEICRAAIATWELPRLVLPDLPGLGETFGRLKTSLRMMHLGTRPATPAHLHEIRERYLRQRLDDQLHYHQARAARLARLRRRLITLFWTFSVLAVVRGLFVGLYGTPGFSPEVSRTLTHFLPLALPGLAGCALALVSVFDLNGQLAHSRALTTFLAAARREIQACQHVPALGRAIARVEHYLAQEIAAWFILSQDSR